MAIARGAGTEIIRSATFSDIVGTSETNLIIGVQHHIYTVLSMFFRVNAVNTAGTDTLKIGVRGYDSLGGTTAQFNEIFRHTIGAAQETFVWNDKFSFNGYEPTDFSGPMDDATKQDAIADQGSSVAQKITMYVSHASTQIDATITYIDQNNA